MGPEVARTALMADAQATTRQHTSPNEAEHRGLRPHGTVLEVPDPIGCPLGPGCDRRYIPRAWDEVPGPEVFELVVASL